MQDHPTDPNTVVKHLAAKLSDATLEAATWHGIAELAFRQIDELKTELAKAPPPHTEP